MNLFLGYFIPRELCVLVYISSHVNEFQVWGDNQLKPASQVLPILEYRIWL